MLLRIIWRKREGERAEGREWRAEMQKVVE